MIKRLALTKMAVVLSLTFCGVPAWAAASGDDASLAAALKANAIVQGFHRVAVVLAGDRTAAAVAAQGSVASALLSAGHEVDVLDDVASLPPSRALLSRIWTERSDGALAVVRISTADGGNLPVVVVYSLGGHPVFEFDEATARAAAPPPPPAVSATAIRPPAPPAVDPLTIVGAGFYDAVGRRDLAQSYRNREVAKLVTRVAGGSAVGLGALIALASFTARVATAVPCTFFEVTATETSPPPRYCSRDDSAETAALALTTLGLGALIVPSFIPTDPLTPAQKVDLVQRGGQVVVTGRF